MSRWAVFASGQGSNLKNFIETVREGKVCLLVSDKPHCLAVKKARRYGVPVYIIKQKTDWEDLNQTLKDKRINYLFLLGFMKIVPASFVALWKDKMLNLHPSLLPKYPGLKSLTRAYKDHAPIGVTVHKVTAGVDEGPIIQQKTAVQVVRDRHTLTIEQCEFLMHKVEQILVRKVARSWSLMPISL